MHDQKETKERKVRLSVAELLSDSWWLSIFILWEADGLFNLPLIVFVVPGMPKPVGAVLLSTLCIITERISTTNANRCKGKPMESECSWYTFVVIDLDQCWERDLYEGVSTTEMLCNNQGFGNVSPFGLWCNDLRLYVGAGCGDNGSKWASRLLRERRNSCANHLECRKKEAIQIKERQKQLKSTITDFRWYDKEEERGMMSF